MYEYFSIQDMFVFLRYKQELVLRDKTKIRILYHTLPGIKIINVKDNSIVFEGSWEEGYIYLNDNYT